MNGLSWLLYFADVFGNAKVAGQIIGTFGLISSACLWGVSAINRYDRFIGNKDAAGPLSRVARNVSLIAAVAILVAVVSPSRNTIMLIAASEVGASVLASEQAQEIGGEAGALAADSLRVLRNFINEQLEETK